MTSRPEEELDRLTKRMLYDMEHPPSEEYFGKTAEKPSHPLFAASSSFLEQVSISRFMKNVCKLISDLFQCGMWNRRSKGMRVCVCVWVKGEESEWAAGRFPPPYSPCES